MDIGKRLLELRTEKNLSQGGIEKRTGLLRCYVSRVENGHTIPSLETLERWAKALEVELYQLFVEGDEKPESLPAGVTEDLDMKDRKLILLLRNMNEADRNLILDMARKMAKTSA